MTSARTRCVRRIAVGAVAATAAVAAAVAGVGPAAAGSSRGVRIDVDQRPLTMADGATAPPVSSAIVGANARWAADEQGGWDGTNDRPAAGFTAAAKGAKLDMVRYPGGTIANLFDFTAAIGPQDQRGCQTSGGFAAPTLAPLPPEQNRFGPDEEQELVASFGGETMIMVPSINQTAQKAADFVEYMNSPSDGARTNPGGGIDWAEVRARNGHRAPYGIRTWEYGNEPYGPAQRYWRAVDPAARARDFVYGGWERQTADSPSYQDNDGLFSGCDLLHRQAGTGAADQTFRTRYRPVALPSDATPESGPIAEPVLTVGGAGWTRVDDLTAAGPADTVYAIDRASGTVRFGDGIHGAIPPQGAALSVEYTTGRQDGFLDFQRAMTSVDPTIKVCAGYAKPEFIEAMGSHPYDCLGVHSYTSPVAGDAQGAFPTPKLYDDLMRLSAEPTAELAGLRTQLAGYFPDAARRPKLIVSEYGTLNGQNPPGVTFPSGYQAMLMHNLYISSLLVGQIQNGVGLSINSNLNAPAAADPTRRDWGQLLASPPGFLVTGRAQAISLASPMIGARPHDVKLRGNPTTEGAGYPALVATATCSQGVERILIVNRDRSASIPFSLGATGARSARITTVTADDVTAFNTDTRSPITTTTVGIAAHRGGVASVLRPHSTNLLEVRIGYGGRC